MAVHYKTRGFVFKKEDRMESDRVFSVFTKEYGRIEVYGKAIRKIASKLKSGIEIFSLSELEFIQGKNKKTLTDAVFLETFSRAYSSVEHYQIACNISELVDQVIHGQEKDEAILQLLIEVFEKLNSKSLSENGRQLLYHYFFWNFMEVLGYGPELSVCAVCAKKLQPLQLYFSSKEGGIMCASCQSIHTKGRKIASETVKVMRLLLKKEWELLLKIKIDQGITDALKKVSDAYYTYVLAK